MMKRLVLTAAMGVGLMVSGVLGAEEEAPAFRDPELPIERRVADLVGRLTLEEKAGQLMMTSAAIPRLGIPVYDWWNECIFGVGRAGKATVFPQPIGMAATWNPELIRKIATAISDEARAKHQPGKDSRRYQGLTFWSPTINMARDPRWGRTVETYGEDPYLTSRLALEFVRGLQGEDGRYLKLAATPKHFAAHNQEQDRHGANAKVSEQALREYYLPAFRACIVEGKAESIMCAYNAVNSVPNSANELLLTTILRQEWGFAGTVVTDVGAMGQLGGAQKYVKSRPEGAAAALKAGVNIFSDDDRWPRDIVQAVKSGLIDEGLVNRRLSEALTTRMKLGMFDPPERVAYNRVSAEVVGCQAHRELAREAAAQSLVLLKNEDRGGRGRLLPLDRSKIKSIAVLGPWAQTVMIGDYAGAPPSEPVSPAAGIQALVGPGVKLNLPACSAYTEGLCEVIPAEFLRPGGEGQQKGLRGAYYGKRDFSGEPVERVDAKVDFDWQKNAPMEGVPADGFAVRWTGKLAAPTGGEYELAVRCDEGCRLYVDDKLVVDRWGGGSQGRFTGKATLEAGKEYALKLEYFDSTGNASVHLDWMRPDRRQAMLDAELKAARESDAAIIVLGLDRRYEREGKDREYLGLPPEQEQYLQTIGQANPNTVLVVQNGGPLALNWAAEHVPAIVEMWYPGPDEGMALADVLLGVRSPGGKLPVTVYASMAQLPPMDDYEISHGRTYMHLKEKPLWAFGHGLSYTTFRYEGLRVDKPKAAAGEVVNVSVEVTNTGQREGEEVVQLYVREAKAAAGRPLMRLRGFRRVRLAAGESATVRMPLAVADLGYWQAQAKAFAVEEGAVEVMVGAASDDIRLRTAVEIRR